MLNEIINHGTVSVILQKGSRHTVILECLNMKESAPSNFESSLSIHRNLQQK
jgi:hypothetical protein